MTRRQLGFWALSCTTIGLYLSMVGWSLPRIASAAGGVTPFDMRPTGYSYDDALAFLRAITPEGRDFYLSVQHRLDLVYPPLLGLSLGLALWHLLGPARAAIRIASIILCLAVTSTDLWENVQVAALLQLDPDAVGKEMVVRASTTTITKSLLTTLAMSAMIVALMARALSRRRHEDNG